MWDGGGVALASDGGEVDNSELGLVGMLMGKGVASEGGLVSLCGHVGSAPRIAGRATPVGRCGFL